MRPAYALISGAGRSGTNWLLELFDLSPETFCRNEPHGIVGSPLMALDDDRRVVRGSQEALEAGWDDAVRWAITHMGDADPRIRVRKDYLYEVSRRSGLYRAVHGPKFRRGLSLIAPSLKGGEWPLPWWLGNRHRLEAAFPVLKIPGSAGWVAFVLRRRPGIPVVHIVRHPGGFLNSWSHRYVARRDANAVVRQSRERLYMISKEDSEWAERFGDIERLSVDELELFFWRYANDVMYRAGAGSDFYHHIVYEDLVADAANIMKRLYAACGLPWSDSVERAINATTSRSTSIADAWRDELTSQQVELVERAIEACPFYPSAGHAQ